MESKRELNDILISDDDLQKQNRTKKMMMLIAMALIFLCILIAVVFVITRDEEELGERDTIANNSLTPIESPTNDTFIDVPLDDKPQSEIDPFQQILDDIRSRETGATQTTQSQNPPAQPKPTAPSKPAQDTKDSKPAQPVLPAKPVKPDTNAKADTKVAQNQTTQNPPAQPKPTAPAPKPAAAQTPSKPTTSTNTTQTTQTAPATSANNIANIFEDVPSARMDTSKNGQVAEKGFYVQVGSFANKPSAEFLKQLSNYSYRVYAGTSNGIPTTKYLIGPYATRTEASRDLPMFKTIVPDPVHFEVK